LLSTETHFLHNIKSYYLIKSTAGYQD